MDNSSTGLASAVQHAVDQYVHAMDDQPVLGLYDMVLSEIEAPLLECILNYTGQNQSRTAIMLGLNRGTLRKKMKKYGLL